MNKNECLNTLQKTIKNKEPIKVFIEDEFYDIMIYDNEQKKYQGEFGYIPMETISKILTNDEKTNHIKLESFN